MARKSAGRAASYITRQSPALREIILGRLRTDSSTCKLEISLARKATTVTRLHEEWVENKCTVGAVLCGAIPTLVIRRLYAHTQAKKLTLRALTMLQPYLRGMRRWGHGF
jgi:hypothetical protein